MSGWKSYRKSTIQRMRPYEPGEDLTGVSVSEPDKEEIANLLSGTCSHPPGMIAYNENNLNDRWYVAYQFFKTNYIEV